MRISTITPLLALLLALGLWRPAEAHPIDSINIDQYSRLAVGPDAVQLRYVIEMGDIPAFSERMEIDADRNTILSPSEQERYLERRGRELLAGLSLSAAGAPLPLEVVSSTLSVSTIQVADLDGGLITIRLQFELRAALPAQGSQVSLEYKNANFADAPGWHEIVVVGRGDVVIGDSTALAESRSDELRSYPENALEQPLTMRSARFTVTRAAGAGSPTALEGQAPQLPNAAGSIQSGEQEGPGRTGAARRQDAGLARLLVDQKRGSLGALFSLLLAFLLGAGHALAPGHGKTIVAAYLAGKRGRPSHALWLGLITTITHTSGVFLLGAVTLWLSAYVMPQHLYPWLELLSGLLVCAIGLRLLRSRLAELRARRRDHGHDEGHDHAHTHDDQQGHDHDHGRDHPHGHSHALPLGDDGNVSWRGLLALGVSGGLVPCPSALVVLLAAIALHQVGFGMLLIVAFSAGLATVLTAIGLLLIHAQRLFERFSSTGRLLRGLGLAGASAIIFSGLLLIAAALTA